MSIIRVKKDKGYFAASNKPFNDKDLSWEARGVLGYLLSKKDDWQVRFYDLVNQGPAGEYKMRRVLKELEEHGYLERERIQKDDGTFDWVSIVYETSTISRLSTDGSPTDGLSIDGSPTGGKPRDIVSTDPQSNNGKNTEEETTDVLKGVGGVGFYIFNLVGFDFKDADNKTRSAIDQLITQYGEMRIAAYADYLVGIEPGIKLLKLLQRINHGIADFVMTETEPDYL